MDCYKRLPCGVPIQRHAAEIAQAVKEEKERRAEQEKADKERELEREARREEREAEKGE